MPYRCWSADSAREDRPPTMHVVTRGVDRSRIFVYPEDYEDFVERLAECAQREEVQVHAFCLMENHLHLLVTGPLRAQANLMQAVKTGHARRFNSRYLRQGPLYDGPYVQVPVFSDRALLYVSCYIHMNPVVAGTCADPAGYPWSSCRWVAEEDPGLPWFRRDPVLRALRELEGPGATYEGHLARWPQNYGLAGESEDPRDRDGWVESFRIASIRSTYARFREILLGAVGEHPRVSGLAMGYLTTVLLRERLAEPIEIAKALHYRNRFSIYSVFKRYRKSRSDLARYRWILDLLDHEWPKVREAYWGPRPEPPLALAQNATTP